MDIIIQAAPDMNVKLVRQVTNKSLAQSSAEEVGITLICETWIAAKPMFQSEKKNVQYIAWQYCNVSQSMFSEQSPNISPKELNIINIDKTLNTHPMIQSGLRFPIGDTIESLIEPKMGVTIPSTA